MKNKWLNRGILALTLGCLGFSMAGCNAQEKVDDILEKVHLKSVQEEVITENKKKIEPEVPVEKPVLDTNLSGSVTYKVGDIANALTVAASTSDGGVVSYQWYQSLTNTNGGGTIIDGATDHSFTPPTNEVGTVYYYVVATSTIKSSTNRITSDVVEVIVNEEQPQPAEQEQPAPQPEQPQEQKPEDQPAQ